MKRRALLYRGLGRLLIRSPSVDDQLQSVADLLGSDVAGVEELRSLLGDSSDEIHHLIGISDHLPRVRPLLVALAARASGAEGEVDRDLQHAAELLHFALVIHDVALGREGGRRRRVARRLVRRSVGWLGGNQATLRALELVRHGQNPEILGELVDTLREFSDGQALARELQLEAALPTQEDWLDHVDAHTGALFSFCCRAGAHLGNSEPVTVSSLGRYGRHVGRLWNLAEDVSQLQHGDGGAHLLSRALSGRPMMPVVIAAERDPELGVDWSALVANPSLQRADDLALRVVHVGGTTGVRRRMASESWSARRALSDLEPTPYRRGLEQFAAVLVNQRLDQVVA